MPPRDDNPALFRENVYKSWKIMAQLTRRIDGECYVVHSDTPEGVGYDSLVLMARTPSGSMVPQAVMNRNGVNSLTVPFIWKRFDEIGIENVVEELLTACQAGKTPEPIESELSRCCDEVVSWIEEHHDEDFYVGPVQWWGSCRELLDIPKSQFPSDIWPFGRHGSEISLGINGIEVRRLSSTKFDTSQHITREGKNVSKSEKAHIPVEFPSLDIALQSWSRLKYQPEVWQQIHQVIGALSAQLGEVSRVHIPESQSYIGVTFASRPRVVGAYISTNHVDHIVELPGAETREKAPGYWRSVVGSGLEQALPTGVDLPLWTPRKDSEERRVSANTVIGALLASRQDIHKSHLKELLSIAVWKYTECDGKYNTRYRSHGAITRPTEKLNHEHVVPRKLLVDAMLENPERCAEILESAIGCTVLEEEHKKIMQIEKNQKGLLGWDRYRAAGVAVYDLGTGEQII